MPEIGQFHPQIVHFVVALAFVGVGARVLSLLPLPSRFAFLGPAAATLIILGTVATVLAVQSGDDAHQPVERVPGSRAAVMEHEDAGEWARNVFLVVSLLEIAGLVMGARSAGKGLRVASTVVGLVGLVAVYKAADRGGELVYGYAGGIGIRSGDTADVSRLLVAGLYHSALKERAAGHPDEAARLMAEVGRRMPQDTNARFLVIESTLRDAKNPAAALAALDSITVPPGDARLVTRVGTMRANALAASGRKDSARVVINGLLARYPDNARLKLQLTEQLERLK